MNRNGHATLYIVNESSWLSFRKHSSVFNLRRLKTVSQTVSVLYIVNDGLETTKTNASSLVEEKKPHLNSGAFLFVGGSRGREATNLFSVSQNLDRFDLTSLISE